MIKSALFTIVILTLSGCASFYSQTNQTFPVVEQELRNPEMALIIVKRKVEHNGGGMEVEITDNKKSVGFTGINKQEGRVNNWLIWERPEGEMKLQAVPTFSVTNKEPFIVNVKAGSIYEYIVEYNGWNLELEKL